LAVVLAVEVLVAGWCPMVVALVLVLVLDSAGNSQACQLPNCKVLKLAQE